MEPDLNSAQREAITATEGFIRVIAGAGSGKTRALTHRFAYLVNDLGILPGNILCVTFTNKAANEMRQRIHNLTGDNDTGYINTFHGFCVSVLQEDISAVQYPKRFLVLDNSDIDSMLRIIYDERGLTLRDMTFSAARDMIEIQKLFKKPDYYLDLINLSPEALQEKYRLAAATQDIIFYGYLCQQKKCFGLDYNDLIKFTLYVFQENEEIRLKWQRRLEYIMIDEFQDIDQLQYTLMEVLCGYHKNLFIVGDPDQTIYTWRGADVRYLLDFDKHHPGTRTIMMMENYRSTPQIIAAANSLISRNATRIKKDLIPTLPDGGSVLCHHGKNADQEAEWIAARILELADAGANLGDAAVLYRAHYVTRSLEEVFRRRKLPYTIYSGVQFYGRAEIKDALSYLRLLAYRDDLSFRRVVNTPRRNIGVSRMKVLEDYAAEEDCSLYTALVRLSDDERFRGTGARKFIRLVEELSEGMAERPVSELLGDVLHRSGYEETLRTEGSQERLDNLAELRQSVYEYETSCGEEATLEHYLSHIALFTNGDTPENAGKVKLMTVHAAKGLEFPYVFLCGMNEGIFPSRKIRTLPAMEEERRLAFVAFTRAQKRLFLSEGEGRGLDGSPRYPSRFILDVDPELIEYTQPPREELIREARSYIAANQSALPAEEGPRTLPPGARVKHPILGTGTVLEADTERNAHVVKFDAMDTPRAIAFRAKLEILEE
ncbi:MAG: UvrD-helicase domain-containing protein [Oscillospiraceae bacterium]|nr:UvrD-helicase domain-containing protein [Oscillospiraceae bacterium]